MDEALQFLKRDIEVIFNAYSSRNMEKLKMDPVEEPAVAEIAQKQQFWTKPQVANKVDDITESFFQMMKFDCPSFSLGFSHVEKEFEAEFNFDGINFSQWDREDAADMEIHKKKKAEKMAVGASNVAGSTAHESSGGVVTEVVNEKDTEKDTGGVETEVVNEKDTEKDTGGVETEVVNEEETVDDIVLNIARGVIDDKEKDNELDKEKDNEGGETLTGGGNDVREEGAQLVGSHYYDPHGFSSLDMGPKGEVKFVSSCLRRYGYLFKEMNTLKRDCVDYCFVQSVRYPE